MKYLSNSNTGTEKQQLEKNQPPKPTTKNPKPHDSQGLVSY